MRKEKKKSQSLVKKKNLYIYYHLCTFHLRRPVPHSTCVDLNTTVPFNTVIIYIHIAGNLTSLICSTSFVLACNICSCIIGLAFWSWLLSLHWKTSRCPLHASAFLRLVEPSKKVKFGHKYLQDTKEQHLMFDLFLWNNVFILSI